MKDEQLQKLESLGILLASFSKHAYTAGEGSMRDKFVKEIVVVLKEIDDLLLETEDILFDKAYRLFLEKNGTTS